MKTYKVWTLVQDNGDGSSCTLFFRTREEAQAYEDAGKENGEYFGDGISTEEFTFDEQGLLVNGQDPYEVW